MLCCNLLHMPGIKCKWQALAVLALLLALCLMPHLPWISLRDFTEVEKCPACYGVSLCPAMNGGEITLSSFDIVTAIMNIIGSKNVMFGTFHDRKIVLKKLGHTTELNDVDKMICALADLDYGCSVSEAILKQGDLLQSVKRHVSQSLESQYDTASLASGLRLCPSVISLEIMLRNVFSLNRDISINTLLANIWTTIMVNPEPLILQILPEEDGWPVPKYLGACGRLVAEEYAGEMLTYYHQAPWLQRVKLAYQLLVAALNFTDSHPQFSFYLTDISPDNIAVDAEGRLKFVDLENVIVVDRNTLDQDTLPSWNVPHESEIFDCDGCFIFSPDDICRHKKSDHNFFAVCQHLLHPLAASDIIPGGLLHDTPPSQTRVLELVEECSKPVKLANRFTAAQELISELEKVLHQQV
ncbi:divergent protein kinase domain 2A isoform X2 [Periplaneta americana]